MTIKSYEIQNKKYYVANSYMGVNFTWDSPCWSFYSFDSSKERDKWVWENMYNDQNNLVSESINAKTFRKAVGCREVTHYYDDGGHIDYTACSHTWH